MEQEILDDLRETVLDNLPDTLTIRKKGQTTVTTEQQPDGMGGFVDAPIVGPANPDSSSENTFRCRVTSPRSASRGAEILRDDAITTETNAVVVVGIPSGGRLPNISDDDSLDVVDAETGKLTTYQVQRFLPHSSPFTLHYDCIYL